MAAESAVTGIERSTAAALGVPESDAGEGTALLDLAVLSDLTDTDVLGRLVARRWPDADSRISATLWWYSSSSVIMSVVASQMLVTGMAVDPRSAAVTLDDGGVVSALTGTAAVDGRTELGAALDTVCSQLIASLTSIAGGHSASLWAIASDSLANRALDVGAALSRIGEATSMAAMLASRAMPTPRYVDLTSASGGGSRRFVRRNSCCLLLEVGQPKCISCPRQQPDVRSRRLATLLG